jgi:hypothetical protein
VVGAAWRDAETGKVSFGIRQLGDFVVRPRPVQRADGPGRCPDRRIPLGHSWPGPPEDETVGLVELEDRLSREDAFNVLTDFRLHPAAALVEFKNEEDRDTGATRANDRNHIDEDYLMDPGAAAAVARLGPMVEQEWLDPISSEAAYRVRVTEAYDSLIEHSPRSSHYHGRAIDLTLSPVPAPNEGDRRAFYGRLSSMSVCAGFDYVLFENQYHVHASVLPTRIQVELEDGRRHSARLISPGRWQDDTVTDGSGVPISPALPFPTQSQDGIRTLAVAHGQVWLGNGDRPPGLGAVDADGTPVDLRFPYPLTTLGPVRSVGFVKRGRTWDLHLSPTDRP